MTKDDMVSALQALYSGSVVSSVADTDELGAYDLISADGQASLVKWRQADVDTVAASGAGEFDVFGVTLNCQIGEQVFNAAAPGGDLDAWLISEGVATEEEVTEFMVWNGHSDGAFNAGMMRQLHRIARREL